MNDDPSIDFSGAVWLRREAIADGLTDRQVAALVRSGEWHRLRRGAYCLGGVWAQARPEDRHRLLCRAVLRTAHPTTVLSHVSSAIEHGADTWGTNLDEVHTTRTDGKGGRKEAGIVHHRCVLPPEHVEVINGVPVTIADRSAVEVCVMSSVEPALVSVNSLLHKKATTLERMAPIAKDARFWPDGITTRIVMSLADSRIESVGESRFVHFCYAHRLPRPTPQVEVRDEWGVLIGRTDFALPRYGVFVEFDGREKYTSHRLPDESLEDFLMREKRREELICLVTGWICVRITWADFARPDQLARRIRAVLESRSNAGA